MILFSLLCFFFITSIVFVIIITKLSEEIKVLRNDLFEVKKQRSIIRSEFCIKKVENEDLNSVIKQLTEDIEMKDTEIKEYKKLGLKYKEKKELINSNYGKFCDSNLEIYSLRVENQIHEHSNDNKDNTISDLRERLNLLEEKTGYKVVEKKVEKYKTVKIKNKI